MQQADKKTDKGAAIIPFASDRGRLRFLLHTTFTGRRKGLLVDFGGGGRTGESAAATAAREFVEETEGMYFGDTRGYLQMRSGEIARQQSLIQRRIEATLAQHPGWQCQRQASGGKITRTWQTFFVEIDYRPVTELNRLWAEDDEQRYRKQRELIWMPASRLLECYRAHPERLWNRLREYQGVEEIVEQIERTYHPPEKLTPAS
ncbi:MAG: hypothetical protein KDI68_14235 [Gammaproteobacteria bacterium]|nr:hypothetical protein [Gammaproteobacteria bacterium]